MKPRQYSSEGLILSKRNHSEADRIFTLLSKKFGKIKLLAKGVRKLKSRKRGHLELFSQVKFSAAKLPGIDLITEAELVNDFPKIRDNLAKMSVAYYFSEVISKILREGEAHDEVYDLFLRYLSKLQKENKLKPLRLEFVKDLLILLGYWPENKKLMDADVTLDDILERNLSSVSIGKKILQ